MSSNSTLSPYELYLIEVQSGVIYYFLLVSSAIGIPGNLLSILVFSRLLHQKTNMAFLCISQSVIDLTLLILTLLYLRGSAYVFGYALNNVNPAWCKSWAFFRRFFLHISSWMVVLTSFDRFVFVLYEQKFIFMKNKRNLILIILVMFTLIAIADIPNFFYYIVPAKSGSSSCVSDFPITISSDIISIVLRTYLPIILMLAFNILMLRKIFRSSRATFNQTRLSRKEHQFTISVMSYDAFFFIVKFPITVYYILYDVNLYSGALSQNYDLALIYNLVINVFLDLSYFDQTFSFFLYLAFNKIFRSEFISLSFLPFVSRRRPSSIESSHTGGKPPATRNNSNKP